ncbi:MAG: Holliday junction branch migration protein RuvA [Actinomycetota bacterium]
MRGRLATVDAEGVVVEVGGVGLLLRVSATTLGALPRTGGEAVLDAHLVVREDALDLYGFATRAERELFEALISVSGVGPRLALAICGLDAPDALRLALVRGDARTLQRAPGVGKRTAERVVLELRDRLAPANGGPPEVARSAANGFLAARDGLVGLGFTPEEADAALADAPASLDPEALLRHGLDRLRRT